MVIVKLDIFKYSTNVKEQLPPTDILKQIRSQLDYPTPPTAAQVLRQIQQNQSHVLIAAENAMRAKGHRVKERKLRRTKDPIPSVYEKRIFGIEDK
jgi:hypothetical protein